MTPQEAADLAARTLAAIDAEGHFLIADHSAADRGRVASDLAGIERHAALLMYQDVDPSGFLFCRTCEVDDEWPCPDAARCITGQPCTE